MKRCNLIILFIAAAVDNRVTLATRLSSNNDMRYARQLGVGAGAGTPQSVLASFSTFDYWWPYPAWTATATATATVTSEAATPATMIPPVLTSVVPMSQDNSLSSSLSSSSDSSTPSSSSISITPTPVVPSSTSTASVDSHNRTKYFISSSHFLLPLLIAVLGAIVGAILVYFMFKRCLCRGRRYQHHRRRCSYYYPTSSGKGWRVVQAEEKNLGWWKRLFGRRAEVEDVIAGPRYVGIDDPESGRIVTGTEKDDNLQRLRMVREDDDAVPDEEWDVTSTRDDDPFLPPSIPKRASTKRPLIQSRSATLALLDMYDSDQEDEIEHEDADGSGKNALQVPWESLRHKSIKRAILARVDEEKKWSDSVRGVRAAKARAALAGLIPGIGADRSRAQSTWSQRGDGERGFRIVVESPPPQILTPGGDNAWSLASAFPFPMFSNVSVDRYTPVPTRMRSDSKSKSESRSKSKSRGSSYAHAESPLKGKSQCRGQLQQSQDVRIDLCKPSPSVLRMRSPPSVMTPQMESALCFTPVIGAAAESSELCGYGGGKKETRKQSGRKLRRKTMDRNPGNNSPRPDAYPGRFAMRVKSVKVASVDRNRTCTELEPEPGTIYTKTYRDRTDRAIKRVEAIIDSGWNERGRIRHM